MIQSRRIPMELPAEKVDGRWSKERMKSPDGRPVLVMVKVEDVQRAIREDGLSPYRGNKPGVLAKDMKTEVAPLSGAQRGILQAADFLPMAGSITGGVLGGGVGTVGSGVATAGSGGLAAPTIPGAAIAGSAVGSGIGAGLGQAGKEAVYRLSGMGDAPGTVLGEAGMSTVLGAAGGTLMKGAGKLGEGLVSSAVGKEALRRAGVVQTMIREKIPVGRIIRTSGLDKAATLLKSSAAKAGQMLQDASNQGIRISRRSISNQLKVLRDDLARINQPQQAAAVEELRRNLVTQARYVRNRAKVGRASTWIDPVHLNEIKRGIDNVINWTAGGNKALAARSAAAGSGEEQGNLLAANYMREWLNNNIPGVARSAATGRQAVQEALQRKLSAMPVLKKFIKAPPKVEEFADVQKRTGSLIDVYETLLGKPAEGSERFAGSIGTLPGIGIGLSGALSGNAMGTAAAAGLGLGLYPNIASRLGIGLAGGPGQSLGMAIPAAIDYLVRQRGRLPEGSTGPVVEDYPRPDQQ